MNWDDASTPWSLSAKEWCVAFSISRESWLFRRFDTNDDETPFRFRFRHWLTCGVRNDFAAIEILDPWSNYRGEVVRNAVFAARHVGVNLRRLQVSDIPAHVHLLTTDASFLAATKIDAHQFQRVAWATVEPLNWRETRQETVAGESGATSEIPSRA